MTTEELRRLDEARTRAREREEKAKRERERRAFSDRALRLTLDEIDADEAALLEEMRHRAAEDFKRSRFPDGCGDPLADNEEKRWRREQLDILREAKKRALVPDEDTQELDSPAEDLRRRPVLRFFKPPTEAFGRLIPHGLSETDVVEITAFTEQGKTTLVSQWAGEAAVSQGWCVGVIPADGGRNAFLLRIGQQHGFDPRAIQRGDPAVLDELEKWLRDYNIFVAPDGASFESLVEKLRVRAYGRPILLVLDTFHECEFLAGADIESERLMFEARIKLLKQSARTLPCLVLMTVESNRAFATSRGAKHRSPGVGAGAGTRKLDYAATVAIGMTVVRKADEKGGVEVARLDIDKAKLIGARKGTFHLRLDPEKALYFDTDPPERGKAVSDQDDEGICERKARVITAFRKLWRESVKMATSGKEPKPISPRALAGESGLNAGRSDFTQAVEALLHDGMLEPVKRGRWRHYRPGSKSEEGL